MRTHSPLTLAALLLGVAGGSCALAQSNTVVPVPQTQEACLSAGGSWHPRENSELTPPPSCFISATDAAMPCTDNRQCQSGACLTHSPTATSGTCYPTIGRRFFNGEFELQNGHIKPGSGMVE